MTLWTVLGTAAAQDLVPSFEGEPRSWKVEVHALDPGSYESANHLPAAHEVYGGRLTCTPSGKRLETCAFEGGVLWYGFTPELGAAPALHEVAAPITVDVRWTPTGRIASWDVRGDVDAFRQNLALAYQARVPKGWQFDSPDFRRRLGQELEQRVMVQLLAPLEVDLPRKGDDKGGAWRSQALPYTMRRAQGGLGGTKVQLQVASREAERLVVDVQGEGASTVLPASSAVLPTTTSAEQTFSTKLAGQVTLARADGRVLASELWTATSSTLPILGFRVHAFRATRWTDDLDPKPGAAPMPPGAR